MLQLSVYGPYFGLPDASPFCLKGLLLLKMSGLPYESNKMNFRRAPKGKAPYLVDGDQTIADSHFITRHLEEKYGTDFSGGYNKEDLAKGWAAARMLEEHFYFLMVNYRWLDDDNFWKGPAQFFKDVPAPLRPLITRVIRRKVRKTQDLQGLGRHSPEEILHLAKGDVDTIETLMGDNAYFLGDRPSGVDATVTGFLWSSSSSYFKSPLGDYIRSSPKLMAYLSRMVAQYFPEFKA
jgi:glutathione S-transferase